ncbi:DUF2637 domain-containing protein [Nocardiopsis trehalosi]|uniref:DUF2637 domain-containing protein n=1 Tax=Nocardiopsis trehalosi TaxID=109329 RepID=UPI000ABADB9C|nr:DUF2637 domain-containing protein [Nocardiopsis trehalosi]
MVEGPGQARTDRIIRETTKAVVFVVAGVAAVVSYRHAYAVVTAFGENGLAAYMIPVTLDGLVYASSMVILDAARNRLPPPLLAWVLLWLGITATLAANIAHGWEFGPVGAVVAAWPAVALVGCYEMLMWLIRTGPGARPASSGAEAEDLFQQAVRAYRKSIAEGRRLSERKLAERFGRSRRWARSVIAKAATEKPETPQDTARCQPGS